MNYYVHRFLAAVGCALVVAGALNIVVHDWVPAVIDLVFPALYVVVDRDLRRWVVTGRWPDTRRRDG